MRTDAFWECLTRLSNDCWIFPYKPSQRYPQVSWRGKVVTAHRLAYLLTYGEPQAGMEIAHTCDTPRCCNPEHLFEATHAQNMADAAAKDRWKRKPKALLKGRNYQGSRNGNAKLDEKDVRDIRSALSRGKTKAALARRYSVSWVCIHYIATGKNWSHLV